MIDTSLFVDPLIVRRSGGAESRRRILDLDRHFVELVTLNLDSIHRLLAHSLPFELCRISTILN